MIDKLPDPQSKKDYLSRLKESLTQTDRFEIDLKDYKTTYNFTEITNRFEPNEPITKVVFGSRKIFFGKYLFSGNAIFGKGKYFQMFGCIMKIVVENIFMCLVLF